MGDADIPRLAASYNDMQCTEFALRERRLVIVLVAMVRLSAFSYLDLIENTVEFGPRERSAAYGQRIGCPRRGRLS